jgi:hypothetical protein
MSNSLISLEVVLFNSAEISHFTAQWTDMNQLAAVVPSVWMLLRIVVV